MQWGGAVVSEFWGPLPTLALETQGGPAVKTTLVHGLGYRDATMRPAYVGQLGPWTHPGLTWTPAFRLPVDALLPRTYNTRDLQVHAPVYGGPPVSCRAVTLIVRHHRQTRSRRVLSPPDACLVLLG
jgi:hypothetical protein